MFSERLHNQTDLAKKTNANNISNQAGAAFIWPDPAPSFLSVNKLLNPMF